MPLIPEPWSRVRTPAPIPQPLARDQLLALTGPQFAELLRSHLVPRDDQRPAWVALWALLAGDDELVERTYDTLDDFLDTTAAAVSAGTLDDIASKRATKFADQCQKAWNRLDERPEDRAPLAWAPGAESLAPHARRIIATLVAGIARHRSRTLRNTSGAPSPADVDLWKTLRELQLDPRDFD